MRIVKRLMIAAGMAFALVLVATPVASAVPATELVVADTAGVLYLPQLQQEIAKIDFFVPVKVAIYTRRGDKSDNLNEKSLQFARAEHPEWISADGQKWADGLFVFVLDPDARKIGTYFGENVKISTSQQSQLQDSIKSLLRDAQWTDGAILAVKNAAELMAKPAPVNPQPAPVPVPLQGDKGNAAPAASASPGAAVGGAVGLGAIGAAIFYGRRLSGRKKFGVEMAQANAAYTSVTMDLQVTELNAKTIPAASSYGGKVLQYWDDFSARYRALAEKKATLDALSKAQQAKKTSIELARKFRAEATDLDSVDDLIADTNALLTMNSGWSEAWRRQSGLLLEELQGIPEMLARPATAGLPETAAVLRTVVTEIPQEIEQWGASLAGRSATPEQALDGLKVLRDRLSAVLIAHIEAVTAAIARTTREAELMKERMSAAQREQANFRRTSRSIVDAAYPSAQLATIVGFNQAFQAAQNELAKNRAAATAAAQPTTGYGKSGGSFSGSGSSSTF